MPRWIKADLTGQAGAPAAAGDPFAYVTPFNSHQTARVLYLGQDAHIHELRLEAGDSWRKSDLTDQAGAPRAEGSPFAYLTPFNAHETARVLYLGQDAHIHELRLESGDSWRKSDLTSQADAPDAAGNPFGYITPFDSQATARVLYRTRNGHIEEVRLEAGESWRKTDLTEQTDAPDAQGNPVAYVTPFNSHQTARVLYLGRDAHIHELRLEAGDSWRKSDLIDQAGAPDAAGSPAAYLTPFNGSSTARVVYRARDGHIQELRLAEGDSWHKSDLTNQAGAPAAASDPFAYVTPINSHQTARVLYLGQDAHIYELRLEAGGSWHRADLTDQADASDGEGAPFAYVTSFDTNPTARVLYRRRDGHIEELRLE